MLAHVHKSGTGTGVEPVTPLNTRAEHIVLVFQHSDQTLLKSIRRNSIVKLRTRHGKEVSFGSRRRSWSHHISQFTVKCLHLLNSRYTLLWKRGEKFFLNELNKLASKPLESQNPNNPIAITAQFITNYTVLH